MGNITTKVYSLTQKYMQFIVQTAHFFQKSIWLHPGIVSRVNKKEEAWYQKLYLFAILFQQKYNLYGNQRTKREACNSVWTFWLLYKYLLFVITKKIKLPVYSFTIFYTFVHRTQHAAHIAPHIHHVKQDNSRNYGTLTLNKFKYSKNSPKH